MTKAKRITATDLAEVMTTVEVNAIMNTAPPTVQEGEDGVYRFAGIFSNPATATAKVRSLMRQWRALGAVRGQAVADRLGEVKQTVSDMLLWEAIAVYCNPEYQKIEDAGERAKAMLEEMNVQYREFLHDVKRMARATGDNVRNAKSSAGMARDFLTLCNIFAEYKPNRLSEILDLDLRKVSKKTGEPTAKRVTFGGRKALLRSDFREIATEVIGSVWTDTVASRDNYIRLAQSEQNALDVMETLHFERFEVEKAGPVSSEDVNMTITKPMQNQLGI